MAEDPSTSGFYESSCHALVAELEDPNTDAEELTLTEVFQTNLLEVTLRYTNRGKHSLKPGLIRYFHIPAISEVQSIKLMYTIGASKTLKSTTFQFCSHHYESFEEFFKTMCDNTTMASLAIFQKFDDDKQSYTSSKRRFVKYLANMVEVNTGLKGLHFHGGNLERSELGERLGLALEGNFALQTLDLLDTVIDQLDGLLKPIVPDSSGQQMNEALTKLYIGGLSYNSVKLKGRGFESLIHLLQTNKTLQELSVIGASPLSMGEAEVCRMFQAVEKNMTLQILDLSECEGMIGSTVFATIMDMLLVNIALKGLRLINTPLFYAAKDVAINEQLRQNFEEYRLTHAVDMDVDRPNSARVLLCGYPYSGKTELRKTLVRSLRMNRGMGELKHPNNALQTIRNSIRKSFIGSNKRTKSLEIEILADLDSPRLSLWDVGGQESFHAIHGFMFPNLSDRGNPCSFLLVTSPFRKGRGMFHQTAEKKSQEELRREMEYWLQFIASNSKRSMSNLPAVTVIITHADRVPGLATWASQIISNLKCQFQGVVEVSIEPWEVNALDTKSVRSLARLLQNDARELLGKLPNIFKACVDVRHALTEWVLEHTGEPVMSWGTFSKLCEDKKLQGLFTIPGMSLLQELERRRKAVAAYLHDLGDIIYFSDVTFMVVDLSWFFKRIMARLIVLSDVTGYISIECLEERLRDHLRDSKYEVTFDEMVQLMLRLELCYEKEPGCPSLGLFIPTTLEDSQACFEDIEDITCAEAWGSPAWNSPLGLHFNKDLLHVGRRLQCDDPVCTFLPAGFFCHLQVHLHNNLLKLKRGLQINYTIKKHFINFLLEDMDVTVEYSGSQGSFIDVLVASPRNYDETVAYLREHVMKPIQRLCISPNGCQGVTLVESIVRSECASQQTGCKHRKDQGIPVEELKLELLAAGPDYQTHTHTWIAIEEDGCMILDGESVDALPLLVREERVNFMQRRLRDLQTLEGDLNLVDTSEHNQTSFVLNSLEPFSSEESLEKRSNFLTKKLGRRLSALIDIVLKSKQKEVPRIVLFTEQDSDFLETLVTQTFPDSNTLRLHILCEYERQVHMVAGRPGSKFIPRGDDKIKVAPFLVDSRQWVTLAIKIGALHAVGLGSVIPRPSYYYGLPLTEVLQSLWPLDWSCKIPRVSDTWGTRDESKEAAEQWLVDYLVEKNITDIYGLRRVSYNDHSGEFAWLCEEHVQSGLDSGEVSLCPANWWSGEVQHFLWGIMVFSSQTALVRYCLGSSSPS